MRINQKYELPLETVNLLAKYLPTLQAARLVHGLICLIDQSFNGLQGAAPHIDRENTIWSKAIADLTAPPGANDHRWIQKAVADLGTNDLFRSLEQPDSKRIIFRFDRRILQSFGSCKVKHGFAQMQSSDLSNACTHEEAAFVMLARLNQKRNQPKFDLPFRTVGVSKKYPEVASNADDLKWEDTKRRWCSAIQRVADKLQHSYLIAPNRGPMDANITRVIVKMQNVDSQWSPQKLYKFEAGSGRVIQFKPGVRHRSLSRDELRDRLWNTVIQ